MVTRGRLLAAVRADLDKATAVDLTGLALSPLGHKALYLPRRVEPPWLSQADAFLQTTMGRDGRALLQSLLLDPVRTYELIAGDGQRSVALVSAFRSDEQDVLVQARLSGEYSPRGLLNAGQLELDSAPLMSDAAREQLARLATDVTSASFNARVPDGPPEEAMLIGTSSQTDLRQMRERLWAHGIRVANDLTEPARRLGAARSSLQAFNGSFAVFLVDGCGKALGQLLASVRPGTTPVLLQETAEYHLIELDERLDDLAVDMRPGVIETQSQVDRAELARRADSLLCPSFALTKRCSSGLATGPYPHHERMLDHLQRLAAAAAAWSSAQGSVGDSLEFWMAWS